MLQATGNITELLKLAAKLQIHGTKKNIVSVFDDGGYRELLLATMFDFQLHLGRHGDDALDVIGNNYELKTVNLVDTSGKLRVNPGVTTCHHVNHEIIRRYRNLHAWIVGVFFINDPVEIYEVHPKHIAAYLEAWEKRLKTENITHINNPKVRLSDIRKNGVLHYKNDFLVAKYLDGGMKKGAEVWKDVIEVEKPLRA